MASFCSGAMRAKIDVVRDARAQRCVVQRRDFRSRHDRGCRQAGLHSDGARGLGIVAGDHHDADAGAAAFGNRVRHVGAQRIRERDEALPCEAECAGDRPARADRRIRRAPRPARAGLRGQGRPPAPRCRERVAASSPHSCAIASGAPLVAITAGAGACAAQTCVIASSCAVSGYSCTKVRPAAGACRQRRLAQSMQRDFHRIERPLLATPGPPSPASPAPPTRSDAASIAHRRVKPTQARCGRETLHRHAVLGQRAGLVDAQYRRGAERFDHVDAPRQHVALRNAPGARRHEDRQDHRKLLRQHAHRQRQAREHGLEQIPRA